MQAYVTKWRYKTLFPNTTYQTYDWKKVWDENLAQYYRKETIHSRVSGNIEHGRMIRGDGKVKNDQKETTSSIMGGPSLSKSSWHKRGIFGVRNPNPEECKYFKIDYISVFRFNLGLLCSHISLRFMLNITEE
jgi:hypothetical protein